MAKTHVILNPAAGSVNDVDTLVARIRRIPNAQVCISANPGDAINITKKSLSQGCDMIVAAGGDGTLNEVVNALQESARRITLGLIPLGTGNDFARTFAIPTDIDDAIAMWNDASFNVKTSFSSESPKGRKLKRGGGSSPSCFSHLSKSIERLLIRQGVPVLNRPTSNPSCTRD